MTYVPSSDVEREKFEEVKKQTVAHALSWSEEEGAETYVGGAANRVVSCCSTLSRFYVRSPAFLPSAPVSVSVSISVFRFPAERGTPNLQSHVHPRRWNAGTLLRANAAPAVPAPRQEVKQGRPCAALLPPHPTSPLLLLLLPAQSGGARCRSRRAEEPDSRRRRRRVG